MIFIFMLYSVAVLDMVKHFTRILLSNNGTVKKSLPFNIFLTRYVSPSGEKMCSKRIVLLFSAICKQTHCGEVQNFDFVMCFLL